MRGAMLPNGGGPSENSSLIYMRYFLKSFPCFLKKHFFYGKYFLRIFPHINNERLQILLSGKEETPYADTQDLSQV